MSLTDIDSLLLQALEYYRTGSLGAAEGICSDVLRTDAHNFDALNLLGLVKTRAGDPTAAEDLFRRAVALQPDNPGALNNLGMALRALQRPEAALNAYEKAITLQPGYAPAHVNSGNALMDLGDFGAALGCYDRALALRPNHPETLLQHGIALQELHRHPEALTSFDRLLEIQPNHVIGRERRARSLSRLGRSNEGISDLLAALDADPKAPLLLGTLLRERMKICDWSDYDRLTATVEEEIKSGASAARPFAVLTFTSSPAIQRRAAELWLSDRRVDAPAPFAVRETNQERIHIGVFSADFHNHPMMHLMGEIFARLDRRRFRLSAFSFARKRDEFTEAAEKTFDDFVTIERHSDRAAAKLARDMGVDIAIDRKGYTAYARPGIFLHRAAPVQVNYLAYPGTTGSPEMDYIIADEVLIPPEETHNYSERVAYLPHSYQPRDTRLNIEPETASREEHGLPPAGFVFCCFNNTYKITPDVFTIWASILRRVPGSVIWLLQKSDETSHNLRREAAARGIDPERLIFADRRPLPAHLARHRLADLFLDTLPYNAHTTASDALVSGLPVLTRIGTTFAGRVAASLLHAVGLPELITISAAEYEDLAVRLAQNPAELADLKEKLRRNASTHPLFDMQAYTRDLEELFTIMHERRLDGLPPDHIHLRRDLPAAGRTTGR